MAIKPKTETEKPETAPAEGDEKPEGEGKYVTPEQLNAALTKAMSKERGKAQKTMESSLTALLTKAGILKPEGATPEEEEDDDDPEPVTPTKPAQAQPTTGAQAQPQAPAPDTKTAKQLKRMQAELDKARTEREQEKAAHARMEEKAALQEAMGTAGVRAELRSALTTYLLSDEGGKRVRRDAQGAIGYWRKDADGDEELVPVKDGLTDFLKTDEGKAYVAPRGAGGSGNTTAGQTVKKPNGSGAQTKEDLNNELWNTILGGKATSPD